MWKRLGRIQEGVHLGQTKGLLSNTESLTKTEWHEFLVDTVSMVDCLSQQEAFGTLGIEAARMDFWNWLRVGDWQNESSRSRGKGGGSGMCGKSVFAPTGLVFQAIWGAGETRSTVSRL